MRGNEDADWLVCSDVGSHDVWTDRREQTELHHCSWNKSKLFTGNELINSADLLQPERHVDKFVLLHQRQAVAKATASDRPLLSVCLSENPWEFFFCIFNLVASVPVYLHRRTEVYRWSEAALSSNLNVRYNFLFLQSLPQQGRACAGDAEINKMNVCVSAASHSRSLEN